MTVISVNPLSLESVTLAQNKLKAYKMSLEEFPKNFMEAMARQMNTILEGQAPEAAKGLWTYFVSEGSKSAEAVIVFDGRAEFIEFGTGIVGKQKHVGINEDWLPKLPPPYTEYNRGPTIVHFEDENLDYWVYKDGDKAIRTQGVPADPFIYRSFMELREKRLEVAKYVLNSYGHEAWE